MTTQELTHRPAGSLTIDGSWWSERQLAALRQMGVDRAPEGDLAVFHHVCQRTGLDPFARQIYMIARNSKQGLKWTIQTSIDGFRLIAQRTGEYAGQQGPQWAGDDEVWRDVWLSSNPPRAARVGVYRQGFVAPVWGVAHLTEYQDSRSPMWSSKPALMLAKCAEALALRKAFPLDLSGLYTDEEMVQAGHVESSVPPVTPEAVLARVDTCTSKDELMGLWHEAGQAGVLDASVEGTTPREAITLAAHAFDTPEDRAEVDVVEGVIVDDAEAEAEYAEEVQA